MIDDGQKRLVGWKTIGSHIGRDARTARRWEAERGLPVHRVPGGGSATVWADPDILTLWMKGNSEAESLNSPPPILAQASKRRWRWVIGAGALGALALAAATPFSSRSAHTSVEASAPYGQNAAANDQYRQASLAKDKRTVPGLLKAAILFGALGERYPNNAAAFVGLAEANLLLREFNSLPPETAYRRASIAAQRALAISPNSPEALRALGFIKYWSEADRKQGIKLFERAIAADPNNSQTLHWYGTALMGERRDREALAALDAAYKLNPDSSAIAADRGYGLYLAGEKAKAISTLKLLTQIDPDFILPYSHLERIYLIEGRDAEYLDAAERTARLKLQTGRLKTVIEARRAYEAGGRKAMLASLIKAEEAKFAQEGESAIRLAILHRAAGDDKQVLRWLSTARAIREPGSAAIAAFIEFVPYRDNPAFKSFF